MISGDPNAKTGPGAVGTASDINPDRPLPYRIDFENEKRATAPAQFVSIADQLDENRWSSA